jgi:hypothetical protein
VALGGEVAQPRWGAADRGEYRQAAGATNTPLMDVISRNTKAKTLMTRSKIVAAVLAVLAASAARAEVVTLACQFTKTIGFALSPTTQLTVIIDLNAGTIGVEGTTEKVKISENMVSWMAPADKTRCQMGGINRITGEFGQQILNKSCQEIPAADFNGIVGEGSDANVSELWKGFCIPANKKIF